MIGLILRYSILSLLCQSLWSFNLERVTYPSRQRLLGRPPSSPSSKNNLNHRPFSPQCHISSPSIFRKSHKISLTRAGTLLHTSFYMSSSSASQAADKHSPQNSSLAVDTNITKNGNNSILSSEREKLLAEAEALRERARKLKQEAMIEEAQMKESRTSQRSQRTRESDRMIDRLFRNTGLIPVNSTLATAVEEQIADILRSERWSPEQVLMVLERMQERQIRVQDQPPILTPSQAAVNRPSDFQIGDTRNNAALANETEWNIIDGWIASLINAATFLDDEYNDKMIGGTKTVKDQQQQSASEDSKSSQLYNSRWRGRVAAALKTRRKEMIRAQEDELRRKIAANVHAVVRASQARSDNAAVTTTGRVPDDIQEFTRQTLGIPPSNDNETKPGKGLNVTRVLEGVQAVPMWLPSSLLPFLVKSRATLRKEDVDIIKDRVLLGSRFFCTSSDAIPSAAIFRGNIRTPVGLVDAAAATSSEGERSNHTAVVLEEIQQRLEAQGIAERVQLFMMEDPEWRPGKDSRAPKPLPVLLAISSKVEPTESTMEKATTSKLAKVRKSLPPFASGKKSIFGYYRFLPNLLLYESSMGLPNHRDYLLL